MCVVYMYVYFIYQLLGEVCRVTMVSSGGDVTVIYKGKSWVFNPLCLSPASSPHSSPNCRCTCTITYTYMYMYLTTCTCTCRYKYVQCTWYVVYFNVIIIRNNNCKQQETI